MKDVNKPLREAYFTALQKTGYKAFYMQAPNNLTGNYIIFNSLNSSEVAQKSNSSVNVSVAITLYTETLQYNSGEAIDEMADKIYKYFYPHPAFTLPLSAGFHMVGTDLVSDNTNPWRLKQQLITIDRVIIFRHNIFIQ
jgi:hypothetical protein